MLKDKTQLQPAMLGEEAVKMAQFNYSTFNSL